MEKREEKRKTIMLRDVETLCFSFKNILRIDNFHGLNKLTKLQLDNNIIDKVCNLESLVRTELLCLLLLLVPLSPLSSLPLLSCPPFSSCFFPSQNRPT